MDVEYHLKTGTTSRLCRAGCQICGRHPRAYEMSMARVQIKTSIVLLALCLVAGCSRILDKDRDDEHDEHSSGDEPAIVIGDDDDDHHHDEQAKTTTTTTVHED
jgi:hypothetical protein